MSSHAMVGVKFTPTETSENVKIRGCRHPETEDKFCAECGKSMWTDYTEVIHQIEDIHEDFLEPVSEKLNELFDGFVVATWGYDSDTYYIGYGSTVEDHEVARIPLVDFAHVRNDLKNVLEEYGVWEQCKDTFGLWVISTGH